MEQREATFAGPPSDIHTPRHPQPATPQACTGVLSAQSLEPGDKKEIQCQKYKISQCGPLVKNLLNAHLFIHLLNVYQVPTLCYATCLTQEIQR